MRLRLRVIGVGTNLAARAIYNKCAMNPVTQTLMAQIHDPQITALVEAWDSIETLVIRVYRNGSASPDDQGEFRQVIGWLGDNHPRWRAALEPFWRSGTIKGIGPTPADPFEALLAVDSAQEFVNNWNVMRRLPAIRQAINEWLLDVIRGS